MAQETTRLIPKASEEHETHFKAFLNGTPLSFTISSRFGNVFETAVVVWSVEHVGNKTRFGFKEVKSNVF